eukprot:TRINITY_DN629_c0_g1_i12.p1 TRINITY_DN629_c0_g1~~TRINITY_DN629_c0_g1_i12.p1  ORF type:complete len:413 (+),score=137.17 TRINITY_DN629_c0_g1_i12:90-1328(+)
MAASCLSTVAVHQSLALGGQSLSNAARRKENHLSVHPFVLSTGRQCERNSSCFGASRYHISQRYRVNCALGNNDETSDSGRVSKAQDSALRMMVVPLLASAILAGAAVPSQAEGIDWASLMEAPPSTEVENAAPVAEEADAPSYKDLLQKLKNTVAPAEVEEAAPEPAAPAPLSLIERQQKRAQELAERAAKQAAERRAAVEKATAEREAAARALVEKREAEEARKAAERAEKEAARVEQQAQLAAKREAEESAKAAAQKPKVAVTQAKSEPSVAVSGKKATHGFMPLFLAQLLFFMAYAGGIFVIFFVPEEQLQKVKKPLEELVEKAKPLLESAKPVVAGALEKGQELAVQALPAVEKAYETAKPLAAQAWEASKPVAEKALDASKPLLKQAQEKAKELVNQAKEQVSKSG